MQKGLARAILVFMFASMVCMAIARASDDEDFPGFIRFQGKVTHAGDGYFMISSQKIELMNISYQGKRYVTAIVGINGSPVREEDIRKGDVMVVLGQKMPNGVIMAHSIRLQPHE